MEEGRKRFEIPKPVSVGDEIDVTIESEGGQGDGIAKVESFVVFVKGAKRGDRCRIKINEVKRTYATADKIGEAEAPQEEAPTEETPAEPPAEEAATEEEAPEEEPSEEAPAESAEEAPEEAAEETTEEKGE